MRQRHIHFFTGSLQFPNHILDDGVTAGESLFLETLPDTLGRVTLLVMDLLVGFQDLPNPIEIGIDLRLLGRLAPAVSWRAGVLEDLLERLPVHPRFPQDLSFADAFSQDSAANLKPLFHDHIHFLSFLLKTRRPSQHPPP